MTKRSRRLETIALSASLAAGLAASLGAAACVAQSDQEQQAPEAVEQAEQHDRHLRGPTGAVVKATLELGNLTSEQRVTIEGIAERLKERRQLRKEMKEDLRLSAAEIVRSGSADSETFDEALDKAVDAIEKRVKLSSDAVKEIHATLDPDQRALVADALQQRIDERWGRRDGHHRGRRGFKRVATELMLTTLQVEQLKLVRDELWGKKRRLRPSREQLEGLVDAFAREDFPEALDAFHAEKAEILREHLASAGDTTDTVLSILRDDQRQLLADLIERGSDAFAPREQEPQR